LTHDVLTKAMLEADAEFLKTDTKHHGSTAVWTLIERTDQKPWKITVGNIGDSRVLIGKNKGQICIPMTKDHKPTNQLEMERIKNAGGTVEWGRVDGQLALSRAFGDSPYKENPNMPADKQRVIVVPDITTETLVEDDFLILCCDGIFEALTNEETVSFVADALQKSDDLGKIGSDLLDQVLQRGSKDNMTVVIVQFKDGAGYGPAAEFIPAPFSVNKHDSSFVESYSRNCRRYGISLDEAIAKLGEPAFTPVPGAGGGVPSRFNTAAAMQLMAQAGINFNAFGGGNDDDDDDDDAGGRSDGAEAEKPPASLDSEPAGEGPAN